MAFSKTTLVSVLLIVMMLLVSFEMVLCMPNEAEAQSHLGRRSLLAEKPTGRGGYNAEPQGRGGYNAEPQGRGGYNAKPEGRGGYNAKPEGRGGYNAHPQGRGGYN